MIKLKAPRIYHLPWSEVLSKDDKRIKHNNMFDGKEVVVTVKYDGCLLSSTKVLMADGSSIPIGNLVKNKRIGEYVLGKDINDNLVPSKITNVFYNGYTEDWLSVNVKGNKSKYQSIKCTKNHKFYTDRGYIEAQQLNNEDFVYIQESYIELTDLQKQVILGKLLGDGSLEIAKSNTNKDKAILKFSHKKAHKNYVDFTNKLLGNIYKHTGHRKSGFGTDMLCSNTITMWDIYNTFSCLTILNGKKVSKQIPKEILDIASPFTLALWYMDDGNLVTNKTQRDRCVFSTCAFDDNSCNNLIDLLETFNVKASLRKQGEYNYIMVNADNTEIFFDLISPYITDCMQYKLSPQYRGRFNIDSLDIDSKPVQKRRLRKVKIHSITPYLHHVLRGKYDIETETHNFFANNVLVHNSNISLYNDGSFHSRSLNSSRQHESNDYLHSWWANKLYSNEYLLIHNKWPNLRIVGENMYAVHTIEYTNLKDIFLLHSAWNGTTCLSWEDTLTICYTLNITPVPVLYKGIYNEDKIKGYNTLEKYNHDLVEGYIVRNSNEYEYNQSDLNIAKFVSNRFVIKSDKHWALNGFKKNVVAPV